MFGCFRSLGGWVVSSSFGGFAHQVSRLHPHGSKRAYQTRLYDPPASSRGGRSAARSGGVNACCLAGGHVPFLRGWAWPVPRGSVRLPLATLGPRRFVKVLHTRSHKGPGSGSHPPPPYILRVQGWWVTGWLRLPGLPLARHRHACDINLRQQCWWSGGHTSGYGCRSLQL